MKVFLSVGRTSTPEQEAFVVAVERFLTANGLDPQTVGRTVIRNQQPLRSTTDCMRECVGTIVLAFERMFIANGVEKRGSADATDLTDVKIPTVWNHIEAAMAYALGHPILVLVEKGTREDGLLEKGYDWYVKSIKIEPSALSDPELIALVSDWKTQLGKGPAKNRSEAKSSLDPSQLSVSELLGALRPAQLWSALAAVGTLLIVVAGLAYKAGAATIIK